LFCNFFFVGGFALHWQPFCISEKNSRHFAHKIFFFCSSVDFIFLFFRRFYFQLKKERKKYTRTSSVCNSRSLMTTNRRARGKTDEFLFRRGLLIKGILLLLLLRHLLSNCTRSCELAHTQQYWCGTRRKILRTHSNNTRRIHVRM
jgi:hypothetical protein